MTLDGHNGYLIFCGAIVPKNTVSGGGGLFGICLKYFLSLRSMETRKFMRLKAGVPGISRKIRESLADSLITLSQATVMPKIRQLLLGMVSQEDLKQKRTHKVRKSSLEIFP